ncbi:MAG: hypothetical protein A2033_03020 [Bacteroidetes bacterium GWA2_31_9]|nr:MAG: hypothetical protein A2033_03020 [Bacteroidetes bacterium GWA2_31_9]
MKKSNAILATVITLLFSFEMYSQTNPDSLAINDNCAFDNILNYQLQSGEGSEVFNEMNDNIQTFYYHPELFQHSYYIDNDIEKYVIPVVINVIHNGENEGEGTNISYHQIQTQINALNNEFSGNYSILGGAKTVNISFCLATKLPSEQPESWPTGLNYSWAINPDDGSFEYGVIRVSSASMTNTSSNDSISNNLFSFIHLPIENYLNIWVVSSIDNTQSGQTLAYTPTPIVPLSSLDWKMQGIVIRSDVFGDKRQDNSFNMTSGRDQGKTLVHQIGHALFLTHTYYGGCDNSTGICEIDGDKVCDTSPCSLPLSVVSNCNSLINSCGTGNPSDIVGNYMYYSSDQCWSAFTNGQIQRMVGFLNAFKQNLTSLDNLTATGAISTEGCINQLTTAFFKAPKLGLTGVEIEFNSLLEENGIIAETGWHWDFGDGTINSTEFNPLHIFNEEGKYNIRLTNGSKTYSQYIYISMGNSLRSTYKFNQQNWRFGDLAGLNFTQTTVAGAKSAMTSSTEACLTESNPDNGELLFYSNGRYAWNKSNNLLNSNFNPLRNSDVPNNIQSVSQIISVPDPADNSSYYIIIPPTGTFSNLGIKYAYVKTVPNVSVNLVNQTIVHPNIPFSEIVTALPHCNGSDYWIITHAVNTPEFFVFRLDNNGLTLDHTNSLQGSMLPANGTYGYLKASTDGTKLALAGNGARMYDFNSSSGEITNELIISPPGKVCYGVCFSPNSKFLYYSVIVNGAPNYLFNIFQYNILTGENILIGSTYNLTRMQLGPQEGIERKIYLSNNNQNNIHVINQPNNNGLGCDFVLDAIPLYPNTLCRNNLPNMIDAETHPDIEFASNITNVSCFSTPDGSIDLTITGGVALNGSSPYLFTWSNGATTEDITGLVAGIYTVTVEDAAGCSAEFTVTVTEPLSALSASISFQTNASCFGSSNGSATVTPSGGTAGYSYIWTGGATTNSITNKPAGTYSVTVTDANLCTATADVTITEPLLLEATFTKIDVSVYDGSDGSIDLTVTGGVSPYTYLWSSNGATTQDISGLIAGDYSVEITDANNCTIVANITILQPPPLTLSTTVADVVCNDDCNGSITVTAINGVEPYTYLWDDPESQTTETATDLCVGTYTVIVTDADGNSKSITTIVGSNPSPSHDVAPVYVINSGESILWEDVTYSVNQNIEINNGGTLTIKRSNIYFGQGVKVTVHDGAKLFIDDHSLLTSSDICTGYWKGIYVHGDPTLEQPINPYSSTNPHGFVLMKNYSVVENAVHGFYMGRDRTDGDTHDLVHQIGPGGILWITSNSEIRNFHNGVYFDGYRYRNRSKFLGCSFIVEKDKTPPLAGQSTAYAVRCQGIEGLVFDNCTFINNDTELHQTGGSNRKEAILQMSIASYFGATSSTVHIGNQVTNNRFEKFNWGIRYPMDYSVIRGNTFTSIEKGLVVSSNNIKIQNNIIEDIPTTGNDYSSPFNFYVDNFGLYLFNRSNQLVSNNTFSGQSTGASDVGDTYGIVARGPGDNAPVSNIFNNSFKGIDVGLQTQGSGNFVRCNNFNSNADGSLATSTHSVTAWAVFGKPLQQGSEDCDQSGGDKYAAGNEWKNLCTGATEIDIKINEATSYFLYYAHDKDQNSQLTVKPLCTAIPWVQDYLYSCVEPKTANSCLSENPVTDFSSPGDPDLTDAVISFSTQLNNSVTLIENGDRQDIVDMATSDVATGQLKNAIMEVSPYASDRVLLSALNDKPTAIPPGHIKEIIVANSPVTDTVMQTVISKNLPLGIQNQINAVQVGVSEREKLEGEISWLKAQLQQINNFSVNYYLENADTASAINLLNTSANYTESK